jgi:hypothetical protein
MRQIFCALIMMLVFFHALTAAKVPSLLYEQIFEYDKTKKSGMSSAID